MDKNSKQYTMINFITLLRVPAVLLVMWDHLGPFWIESVGLNWIPGQIITEYINKPLGIIQYFGFFGVALFFLSSGFVITHVAQREGRFEFIIKRFFRIYPALFFSFVSICFIDYIYYLITGYNTYWGQFKLKDYIHGITLVNNLLGEKNLINGVTWSLVIEMIFYFLCFLFIRYIKNNPKISIGLMMIICYSITLMPKSSNVIYNNFCFFTSYIPYLIFGQILYYIWMKKITMRQFVVFSVINYYIMIKDTIIFNPTYYEAGNLYGVSFVYAYLLFIIALLLNEKIILSKSIKFIANISYSLYLNHSTVGGVILSMLYVKIGFSLAFICAIIMVFLFGYISYRFIERPSIKFISTLIKNRHSSYDRI